MNTTQKIAQLVGLAKSIGESIKECNYDLHESFSVYTLGDVLLKDEENSCYNLISSLNLFLSYLQEFFELVQNTFENEEDRNLFDLYSHWNGIDTSPLPYPPCVIAIAWPSHIDDIEVSPEIVDLIRDRVEEFNRKS